MVFSIRKTFGHFFAAVFCAAFTTVSVEAQDGKRVDIAGRQRMLSQKMTKAACFAFQGISTNASQNALSSARALFGESLGALLDGGGADDLAPETDPVGRQLLEEIALDWARFEAAVDAVKTTQDLLALSALSDALLAESNAYVVHIQAGDTQKNPNAHLVNVAGRQRMLIQRLGKEGCVQRALVADGKSPDWSAFNDARDSFATAMFGLTFGDEERGLRPSPTEDIAFDNQGHWISWVMFEHRMLAGIDEMSAVEMGEISSFVDAYMAEINVTVGRYAKL